MRQFSAFLGVDQTGALQSGTQIPKPLPVVHVSKNKEGIWSGSFTQISSFSREVVGEFIENHPSQHPKGEWAFGVDCVVGFPRTLRRHHWTLMREAAKSEGFGRNASERFFKHWVPVGEPLPKRLCEVRAKANSVFVTRPYQKNIQTGTHRIWKDLASNSHHPWVQFWPFSQSSSQRAELPVFFESYPSLLWKRGFGEVARRPERLKSLILSAFRSQGLTLRFRGWERLETNPDYSDAAIIAFSMILLQHQGRLWNPGVGFESAKSFAMKEGWILGLNEEGDDGIF